MLATLKTKSQLTTPKEFIEKLALKTGDILELEVHEDTIVVTPVITIPKNKLTFIKNIQKHIKLF